MRALKHFDVDYIFESYDKTDEEKLYFDLLYQFNFIVSDGANFMKDNIFNNIWFLNKSNNFLIYLKKLNTFSTRNFKWSNVYTLTINYNDDRINIRLYDKELEEIKSFLYNIFKKQIRKEKLK